MESPERAPTVSGLTTDERLLPLGPPTAGEHPKEFVETAESRFAMAALQDGELLPQGRILQKQVLT
jgi:hypothetical protein